MPVVTVPTAYLVYRLDNQRTNVEQLDYLDTHPEVPRDIFLDQERAESQAHQERILCAMIDEKNLRADLIRHSQQVPFVITYSGVVVNGNRRLAAMRTEGIEQAQCIVLPESATDEEIYLIEFDLQLRQDFTLDYPWINDLLAVEAGIRRFQVDKKRDLARMLNLKSAQELTVMRNTLTIVDSFLAWKDRPGAYNLVGPPRQLEEAFRTIAKSYFKLPEALRDAYRYRAFALVDNPSVVEGRLYDALRYLAEHIESVLKEEAERIAPAKVADQPTKPSVDPDDPLSGLEDEEGKGSAAVDAVYRSPETAAKHASTLAEVVDDVTEIAKGRQRNLEAYNAAKAAHARLQGIELGPKTQNKSQLMRQLDLVEEQVLRLKKTLAALMASSEKS
jgi:hypothetical protein